MRIAPTTYSTVVATLTCGVSVKRVPTWRCSAAAKPGVEKVYALQAGREIRVIVSPGAVDDDEAALLAHEIAREIEDEEIEKMEDFISRFRYKADKAALLAGMSRAPRGPVATRNTKVQERLRALGYVQ